VEKYQTLMRFHEFSLINERQSMMGDNGEVIQHPDGGYIDIMKKTTLSPRSQSVIDFVVPEELRNKGIGDWLVKQAMKKYNDLGAQISSLASLKVFFNNGFRHPKIPHGSFEDHVSLWKEEGGSLFLAMNNDPAIDEERKVDPLALQQRVARRYGKKTKYGEFWDDAVKGQHIPLRPYNANTAYALENRFYDFVNSLGMNSRDPEIRAAAKKKLESLQSFRSFDISTLIPTQPITRHTDNDMTAEKLANLNPDNIHIVRYKGKDFIADGHHSIMAAKLRGEKTVNARYTDLDEVFPRSKKS